MKVLFVKTLGGLRPADPEAEQWLQGVGRGEVVQANVSRPRNPKFHAKFMALLRLVFENQEQYAAFEHFRKVAVIAAGFYEDVTLMDGTVQREAKSISFAKMDEEEFGKLYETMIATLAKFIGTDDAQLAREVDDFAWR